jgi:hypothetical protein
MLVFKKEMQTIERQVLEKVVCDKCGRIIKMNDYIEAEEVVTISFTGGYGSVFGDGSSMEAHLCQHCVLDMLGGVLRQVKDNGYDEEIF